MDVVALQAAKADAKKRYTRILGPFPTLLQSMDADDLANVAAGTSLPKWGDRTGKGADLVQATAASQPVVEVDGNGRRQVYFATSKFLASSGFGNSAWGQPASYAQPLTICAVVRYATGGSAFRTIVGGGTQAASLALGLATGAQAGMPQMWAGAVGIYGGPALNDDQWHVVVACFDTTRAYIMVDGYLVGATTSQAHGANPLTKLAVGSYVDGSNNAQGVRVRRMDIYNGVLSPQQAGRWSAEMMQKWGLGTAPLQVNVGWQDVTDAGGQSVRVFTPPHIGTSAPVAILNHPQGGTTGVDQLYWFYTVIHALVSRGFVVTYSNNHGADSWSNDSALTDVANARAYVNSNIATVSGSLLVGASMGGALAMIAAKAGTLPDLRGVYLIDPAVNLQWMYANGYSASINTGFGIASAAAIPAGKDPATLTGAQLPQNMRWRAVASSADTTVSKASNIDVLGPIIQAASPAEYALVTHPDGHIGRGAALPADVDAFAKRCGFTGLTADLIA